MSELNSRVIRFQAAYVTPPLHENKTFSKLPNKLQWHITLTNSDTDDIEVVYNIRNVPYIQHLFKIK